MPGPDDENAVALGGVGRAGVRSGSGDGMCLSVGVEIAPMESLASDGICTVRTLCGSLGPLGVRLSGSVRLQPVVFVPAGASACEKQIRERMHVSEACCTQQHFDTYTGPHNVETQGTQSRIKSLI